MSNRKSLQRKLPERVPYYLSDKQYRRVANVLIDEVNRNPGSGYGREIKAIVEGLGDQRFRQMAKRSGMPTPYTIKRQKAKKASMRRK